MSSPDVVDVVGVMEGIAGTTVDRRDPVVRHELRVDPSERHAALLDLARQCDDFDVRMEHLTVGDYCLNGGRGAAAGAHAGRPSTCAKRRDGVVGRHVAASRALRARSRRLARILRFLADQLGSSDGVLKRYDRKPKRLASRKLYMLQGLPGVGPALAHRLLQEFGSIERVVTADDEALMRIRGVGRQRAAQIRQLIG